MTEHPQEFEPVSERAFETAKQMMRHSPHFAHLDLEMEALAAGFCRLRLPVVDGLVGDPATGIVHGGVITTLLDSACGMALSARLGGLRPMATLDLRIDYLRPAIPKDAIFGEARVDKVTKTIAFLSGVAYQGDGEKPIAKATGSFIIHGEADQRGAGDWRKVMEGAKAQ